MGAGLARVYPVDPGTVPLGSLNLLLGLYLVLLPWAVPVFISITYVFPLELGCVARAQCLSLLTSSRLNTPRAE